MGTIGSNAGGQLNVILFETGMIKGVFGVDTVLLTGIHPLLVAPRSITYDDSSMSQVRKTPKSSHLSLGGRAPRRVSMEGTFGVENRGLLLYLGNGEMRYQRFYKEVVRLSEAMTKDDVQECIDIVNGTPFISLILKPYSEDDTRFFINFFDFWHARSFQAIIRSFSTTRQHRGGGAQGMLTYRMVVEEVGPIVGGNLGTEILSALFDVLTTWNSINNALESYTVTNILDSFGAAGAIVVSELADTFEAVDAQMDSVTQLMGGTSSSALSGASPGAASFLSEAQRLSAASSAVAEQLGSGLETFDAENGTIRLEDQEDEGGSLANRTHATALAALELMDVADFAIVAGRFYGMSNEDYAAFLQSSAYSGLTPPEVGGTVTHVVRDTDTAERLEQLYSVDWGRILSLNRLTPDEALLAGTSLHIPSVRPKGPQGIAGLPTFGSHIGEEAWGRDLPAQIIADEDGDLVTISGEAILIQGAEILLLEKGDEILQSIEGVPTDARPAYIKDKVSALLLTDPRFVGVQDLTVVLQETGIDVTVHVAAINGGQFSVGGN